jgi:hypothetical protein
MAQIIENEKDAGGADRIRFRPYRSTKNPDRILGHWQRGMDGLMLKDRLWFLATYSAPRLKSNSSVR